MTKQIVPDINDLTEKSTPIAADIVYAQDSATSYAPRKIQTTNLLKGGGTIGPAQFTGQTYFDEVVDNGNSGTSKTIDWTSGPKQKITTTGSCVVTFTAPTGPCNLLLKITHEASATAYTYSWPGTVKWPSATALATTNTSGAVDVVSLFFDGTNYYAQGAANFS